MCRTDHSLRVLQKNRKTVKDAVLATGLRGIGRPHISAVTGLGKWTVNQHLTSLLGTGEIERSSETGHAVRYGAPGIWEAYAPVREKTAEERKKYGKPYESESKAEAWANQVPIHRIVPANDAQPLKKPGPASVWELAA